MATFQIGETVICSVEVKDDDGAYKGPTTSMKITITNQKGTVVADGLGMTEDATGKYHYDYQTADCERGKYTAIYKATDGTRITIEKDTFTLE